MTGESIRSITELETLRRRIAVLEESELQRARAEEARRRRLRGRIRLTALGLSAILIAAILVTAIEAVSQSCASGLACFSGGSPALASEVNGNFKQLVDWLVVKTGPTSNGDLVPQGVLNFGNRGGQLINSWGGAYGLGIQSHTIYSRTDENFAWFYKGSHDPGELNPGGGTLLMQLTPGGLTTPGPALLASGNHDSQGLSIFGGGYGLGVQSGGVLYSRATSQFAWYQGGSHVYDGPEPGSGGNQLMLLEATKGLTVRDPVYTPHVVTTPFDSAKVTAVENGADGATAGSCTARGAIRVADLGDEDWFCYCGQRNGDNVLTWLCFYPD